MIIQRRQLQKDTGYADRKWKNAVNSFRDWIDTNQGTVANCFIASRAGLLYVTRRIKRGRGILVWRLSLERHKQEKFIVIRDRLFLRSSRNLDIVHEIVNYKIVNYFVILPVAICFSLLNFAKLSFVRFVKQTFSTNDNERDKERDNERDERDKERVNN